MLRKLALTSFRLHRLGPESLYKSSSIVSHRWIYHLTDQRGVRPLLSTCLSHNGSDIVTLQKRFKKGKKKKQNKGEESDEEDEEIEEEDEIENLLAEEGLLIKDFQDIVIDIPNIRLDVVLKAGLPLSRAKVEEGFYEGRIRVNGERMTKKNHEIAEKDELDYVLGRNPENNNLLDVKRVQVVHLPDQMSGTGRTKLKVRRFSVITIENYPDPYESMVVRAPLKEEREPFKKK